MLGFAGAGLRQALNPILGVGGAHFVLFLPGLAVALIVFGEAGGAAALAVSTLTGALLFLPPRGSLSETPVEWLSLAAFVVSGLAVLWLVASLRSALARLRAALDQERLLDAELQHRVKNTLAMVQSIASQSFRSDDMRLMHRFDERLVALAQAHNLLSDEGWSGVPLRTLVERILDRFTAAKSRLAIMGDDVIVPPDKVASLALCLSELASTAPSASARIAWKMEREPSPRVRVEWVQHDGPGPDLCARDNFARRLLERALPSSGAGSPDLDGSSARVRWRGEFEPRSPSPSAMAPKLEIRIR